MPKSSAAKRTPMARKASKTWRTGLDCRMRPVSSISSSAGRPYRPAPHPSSSNVGPSTAGHIDGKTERLPCRSLLVHLATGLARPRAYFRHQAELGQRRELAGRQQAKPRMPPASTLPRQRSGDRAQIDQRLVMQVKHVAPPPPTRPPSIRRAAGLGMIPAPAGSSNRVTARTNKPVSASWRNTQSFAKGTGGRPVRRRESAMARADPTRPAHPTGNRKRVGASRAAV